MARELECSRNALCTVACSLMEQGFAKRRKETSGGHDTNTFRWFAAEHYPQNQPTTLSAKTVQERKISPRKTKVVTRKGQKITICPGFEGDNRFVVTEAPKVFSGLPYGVYADE